MTKRSLIGPLLWVVAALAIAYPALGHNSLSVPPPTGIVNSGLSASDGTIEVNSDLDMDDNSVFSSTGVLCIGGDGTACTAAEGGMGANDVTIDGDLSVVNILYHKGGVIKGTSEVKTVDGKNLNQAQCGDVIRAEAGMDGGTINLPATIDGCTYTIVYVGADGGAVVDISPNANDAIHGSCTLAASVVEFNGTDDNDIGLTKNTVNTGDGLTLEGDGDEGWHVRGCTGIAANN